MGQKPGPLTGFGEFGEFGVEGFFEIEGLGLKVLAKLAV
jgi:hypothetical protein